MSHQITLLVQAQEKVSCCVPSSFDLNIERKRLRSTRDLKKDSGFGSGGPPDGPNRGKETLEKLTFPNE